MRRARCDERPLLDHSGAPTKRHLRRWREEAEAIPDLTLRELALTKLAEEQTNAYFATAFATLAPRPQRASAIEAIVALQIIYDYLDGLTEQPSADPLCNGLELFRALSDAVSPAHQPHHATTAATHAPTMAAISLGSSPPPGERSRSCRRPQPSATSHARRPHAAPRHRYEPTRQRPSAPHSSNSGQANKRATTERHGRYLSPAQHQRSSRSTHWSQPQPSQARHANRQPSSTRSTAARRALSRRSSTA